MKDVEWLGDSLDVIRSYNQKVREDLGAPLRAVQRGERPSCAKTFDGAIQEIRQWGNDADHRLYYVAKLKKAIYVLHVMKKDTTSGIAISDKDRKLIMKRYGEAIDMEKEKE